MLSTPISSFQKQLALNIEAGAPIIQVITHETLRIRAYCENIAQDLNRVFLRWNRTQGLQCVNATLDTPDDLFDTAAVLNWLDNDNEPIEEFILLLEDAHPDLTEHQPHTLNRLRNFALAVAQQKIKQCCLVLSQPIRYLPIELEKDTQVMDMPLPDRYELEILMQQAKERFQLPNREYEPSPRLLDAALGLSTSEAQLAFAKTIISKKRLTETEIPLIIAEKEQIIRKNGQLEYFHPQTTMSDVGGLNNLKRWLERRKNAFDQEARDYGLEVPRGVLLLGLPGTGKSLAAKAVSNAWQLPLLRFDMGKVFGSLVGQSEENMRSALKTAEALAPCILWIDEIEKALSGSQSSGQTDGGITTRVLGSFLTWMQEKQAPVFVVATANHIEKLPPELLRKGRVDEIFFVDLPTLVDRIAILKIHLKRRGQRDELFTEDELSIMAQAAQGFTGAELEEAIKEALFIAFDEGKQISTEHIISAIKATTPLCKTMHEVIEATRIWAKGRAVPASSQEPEKLQIDANNKMIRLRQEGENPFIQGSKRD